MHEYAHLHLVVLVSEVGPRLREPSKGVEVEVGVLPERGGSLEVVQSLQELALALHARQIIKHRAHQFLLLELEPAEVPCRNAVIRYEFLLDTEGEVEPVIEQQYLGDSEARRLSYAFEAASELPLDLLLELHDQIVGQDILHQFFNEGHLLERDLFVGSRTDLNYLVPLVAHQGSDVLEALPHCLLEDRVLSGILLIAREEAHEFIIRDAGQAGVFPLLVLEKR